jgi:hypothetical protein
VQDELERLKASSAAEISALRSERDSLQGQLAGMQERATKANEALLEAQNQNLAHSPAKEKAAPPQAALTLTPNRPTVSAGKPPPSGAVSRVPRQALKRKHAEAEKSLEDPPRTLCPSPHHSFAAAPTRLASEPHRRITIASPS